MYNPDDLKIRRRTWLKVSGVPINSVGWLLKDCVDVEPDVVTSLRGWVSHVKSKRIIRAYGSKLSGKGLLMTGNPGFGKTTLASSLLQELITGFSLEEFDVKDTVLVRPCYFASYNKILDLKGNIIGGDVTESDIKLFQGIMGECKDDAYNVRVLVVDDVGKEHKSLSGWQVNVLHDIIRNRHTNGFPTVVTTNLVPDDWEDMYGPATRSFLKEAFSTIDVKTLRGDLRLRT
jgi:DNA replication protein DnaC